jgi:hypothetical protein
MRASDRRQYIALCLYTMRRHSTATSGTLTSGAQAGSAAVCAQHANSHIHTTKRSTRGSQMVTLESVSRPMQHTGIPGSSTRGGNHPPGHTRRHTHHGTTHMLRNIYAEEADGTRQGSSPPRRVLYVSCWGDGSLLGASQGVCTAGALLAPTSGRRAAGNMCLRW